MPYACTGLKQPTIKRLRKAIHGNFERLICKTKKLVCHSIQFVAEAKRHRLAEIELFQRVLSLQASRDYFEPLAP